MNEKARNCSFFQEQQQRPCAQGEKQQRRNVFGIIETMREKPRAEHEHQAAQKRKFPIMKAHPRNVIESDDRREKHAEVHKMPHEPDVRAVRQSEAELCRAHDCRDDRIEKLPVLLRRDRSPLEQIFECINAELSYRSFISGDAVVAMGDHPDCEEQDENEQHECRIPPVWEQFRDKRSHVSNNELSGEEYEGVLPPLTVVYLLPQDATFLAYFS